MSLEIFMAKPGRKRRGKSWKSAELQSKHCQNAKSREVEKRLIKPKSTLCKCSQSSWKVGLRLKSYALDSSYVGIFYLDVHPLNQNPHLCSHVMNFHLHFGNQIVMEKLEMLLEDIMHIIMSLLRM